MQKAKKDIRQLDMDQLQVEIQKLGEPKFRAKQIYEWIWKKSITGFSQMRNIPKGLAEKLENEFAFNNINIDAVQKSTDKTIKTRFKLYDNELIEGVLIPTETRMTACISSQVGCSLSCKFCATGFLDRKRNLNYDEIYDQVVLITKQAKENYDAPLSNIVFMGMGEPLLNYKNVLNGIKKITSADGLGMSPKRITVSTAGIAKAITELADDKVKFNLALSLHAADDDKRNKIMPINEHNSLEILMKALHYFYINTGNEITFEYILFNQFNDSPEDAKKLISLCQKFPVKVNLIEYNQVKQVIYTKSANERITAFQKYLTNHNIIATVRRSRGRDIDAACGQLANK